MSVKKQRKKDDYGIVGVKERSTSKVGKEGDASRANHLRNWIEEEISKILFEGELGIFRMKN
jgi:hypothetical protein